MLTCASLSPILRTASNEKLGGGLGTRLSEPQLVVDWMMMLRTYLNLCHAIMCNIYVAIPVQSHPDSINGYKREHKTSVCSQSTLWNVGSQHTVACSGS